MPVDYAALNARQQEAFNFHKVAARLADFGYMSVLLSDDYGGADFLAIHVDGEVLKVQLKSRLTFQKKYLGKGVHVAMRLGDDVLIYDHDEGVERVLALGKMTGTGSWEDKGSYTWSSFPVWARTTFSDAFL